MNYNTYIKKRRNTYNTNDENGYKVYTKEVQTYKVGNIKRRFRTNDICKQKARKYNDNPRNKSVRRSYRKDL